MFARQPDLEPADTVPVTIDGVPFDARAGDTVAAAILAAGVATFRTTSVGGVPRGPYCLMGACFECLVSIDGVANRQGCMVRLCEGMVVTRQRGRRGVAP